MPIDEQTNNEDINLDTREGWKTFFRYATDSYEELRSIGAEMLQTPEAEVHLKQGTKAYGNLKVLVDESTQKLKSGNSITYADSEKAQELYDKIVEINDEISTLQEKSMETKAAPPMPPKQLQAVEEIEHTVRKKIEIEMDSHKNKELDVVDIKNFDIDSPEDAVNMQQSYRELSQLDVKCRQLLTHYKTLFGELASEEAASGKLYFSQLQLTQSRTDDLKKKLESGTVEVTRSAVENIDYEVKEITKNVRELQSGLEKLFVKEPGQKTATGRMALTTDSAEEKSVAILVQKNQNIESPKTKPALSSLRSEIQKDKDESIIPKKLLSDPHFKELLDEHSLSWEQVERNLKKMIIEIEKPSQLDVFLRVKQGSVYMQILSDLTLRELSTFEHRSGEQITTDLIAFGKRDGKQYEYRVYRAWLNIFDEVSTNITLHPETTFGELCVLYEILKLVPEEEM